MESGIRIIPRTYTFQVSDFIRNGTSKVTALQIKNNFKSQTVRKRSLSQVSDRSVYLPKFSIPPIDVPINPVRFAFLARDNSTRVLILHSPFGISPLRSLPERYSFSAGSIRVSQ